MHVAFAQHLQGRLTEVGPGLADIEVAAADETPLGAGLTFASQLVFATERAFQGAGTIAFADGEPALRFTTLGEGDLAPQGGVRHGTAVLDVRGLGRLSGARGRITSNFVVANDGSVSDEQTVVLFVQPKEGSS